MRTRSILTPLFAAGVALCFGCSHEEKPAQPAQAAPKTTTAAAPAKTQAVAQKQQAVTKAGLTVHEAVPCHSVKDKSPVEPASVFKADVGRIYLYTKVAVEGGAETSMQHIWYFNGNKMGAVTLPARGDAWRTYSSKSIQKSQIGEWRVDVASSTGDVVKSVTFKVE